MNIQTGIECVQPGREGYSNGMALHAKDKFKKFALAESSLA